MGVAAALSVRLSADTTELTKGFAAIETKASTLGASVASGFDVSSMAGFSASIGSVTGAFAVLQGVISALGISKVVGEFIETSSQLSDLSAKTTLSTRELQRLEFAGALVGVSLDTIATASLQLQKRLAGGDAGAVAAVKELGLSLNQLRSAGPAEQLEAISTALRRIKDAGKQADLVADLMGRGGLGQLGLLRSDMQGLGDEVERFGMLSATSISGGDRLGDAWTRLQFIGRGLLNEAIEPLFHNLDQAELFWAAMDPGSIIPGWEHLSLLISSVQGKLKSVAPKLPDTPFGFDSGNIRGSKSFLPGTQHTAAEAGKMLDQSLAEQKRKADQAAREFERLAAAQKKWIDQLTGQNKLDEAEKFLKAVTSLGGIGALAPDQVLKGHKLLDDALEILAHRGELASQAMVNLWAASMPRPAVIAGIQNLVDGMGKLKLGTDVGKPLLPIPPLPAGPGVIPGLGGLGMPGTDMGAPNFAAGAVSPFREAFRKFGDELPDLMFGALMRGGGIGSVVGSLTMALGAQFQSQFADALKAAGGDFAKLSGGNKALGVAAMAIQVGAQGFQLGQQFGKGKGALAGAATGAMAGSFAGPMGMAVGAGVGALMGFFGGRSKDKKDKAAMEEQRQQLLDQFGGMEKLKNLAKDLGVNIDLAFTTKKPQEFQAAVESLNTALEKQQATIKATGEIIEGVNARAANVTSQGDLDVVGAGAVAAFALSVQSGKSAIESFNLLTPAITAMKDAMAAGNFTLTESAMKLLGLGAIVDANQVQFTNLAASGQIVTAMLQGNIRDGALFAAVATDIGTQIQTVIDRGVPMAQVFALAQPQLQALWEAQQKWGFAVDDTTQALLTEAAAQGFVGAQMKSINAQILDVLLAIGKVLGADIPAALANLPGAAQSAASGMQAAFDGVKGPNIQAPWTGDLPTADSFPDDVGTQAAMPMADVPFSEAGGTTVVFEQDGQRSAEFIVPHIPGVVQRYGLA